MVVETAKYSFQCQPSKHKTFVEHLYNVGATSQTLGRRCTNVVQMFCVCWEGGGDTMVSIQFDSIQKPPQRFIVFAEPVSFIERESDFY